MGRSTRAQADLNRERIVDVATGLFRQHGVGAVSIADIMKAAGMTQGGFYKHFPSKEALAAEACTTAFVRAVEAWKEKARQSVDGGRTALRDLVTYYFADKPPERTCPMVAFSQEAAGRASDDPLLVNYSEGVKRLFEAFAEVARAGGPPAMTREQIMLLFTSMIGANLLARAIGKEAWTEDMMAVVLGAIDPVALKG
ncbi:TetR family transcriptional regulator [Caballeronia sp. dw_19]|jgi:TetR/AcrR family transcriptional regulator, transcriptional repressor for nem operon|uniref:TetR/AcrR family transcriptional regulator n=1 Tax=Caballeronia sp. dw_19 TaxID=2719791 RepID=UPI001BD42BA0|nr:TetR family transcriptional regulator [Caballeronia sp. dw_19]